MTDSIDLSYRTEQHDWKTAMFCKMMKAPIQMAADPTPAVKPLLDAPTRDQFQTQQETKEAVGGWIKMMVERAKRMEASGTSQEN